MDEYEGREKRRNFRLTEEEMEAIVERAADLAARKATDLVFQRFYGEVGKGVLNKVLGICMLAMVAIASYLTGKGYLK